MKKTIIVILVIIVLGVIVYYLVGNKNTSQIYQPTQTNSASNMPMQQAPANTTTTVAASNAAVSIQNFSFNPGNLQVKSGATVTWTNNDQVAHTVTFNSSSMKSSSILTPGQSFQTTFTSAGTFTYHCSIHPMMQGSVVVSN